MNGECVTSDYGAKLSVPEMDRQPTAREQLNRKKQNFERQLKEVDAALAALDEHPEVEKVLDLVGRATRY